jgi:hypothetical protein
VPAKVFEASSAAGSVGVAVVWMPSVLAQAPASSAAAIIGKKFTPRVRSKRWPSWDPESIIVVSITDCDLL